MYCKAKQSNRKRKGFCNAAPAAPSWQVGSLASRPSSRDYFARALFCFIPSLFIVKYINSPGRAPHTQLRALTAGRLCERQDIPTRVCLHLRKTSPQTLALPPGLWVWSGRTHLLGCSDSGAFGSAMGWRLTRLPAQRFPLVNATNLLRLEGPLEIVKSQNQLEKTLATIGSNR